MSGSWQDMVLGAAALIFSVALVPALFPEASRPPRSTCAITGVTLLAQAAALGTLGAWYGAATNALCAALWVALLVKGPRR